MQVVYCTEAPRRGGKWCIKYSTGSAIQQWALAAGLNVQRGRLFLIWTEAPYSLGALLYPPHAHLPGSPWTLFITTTMLNLDCVCLGMASPQSKENSWRPHSLNPQNFRPAGSFVLGHTSSWYPCYQSMCIYISIIFENCICFKGVRNPGSPKEPQAS